MKGVERLKTRGGGILHLACDNAKHFILCEYWPIMSGLVLAYTVGMERVV